MQVGAGLLGALAVAASAAGWWLLGGFALAALLAACAQWTVPEPEGRTGRLLAGLPTVSALSRVVLFASVFAAYSVPAYRPLAAAGFVVLVAVADAAGIHLGGYWRRWIAGLLIVAALAFVALCVAIEPAARPEPPGSPGWSGLLLAAAVGLPAFAGLDRRRLAAGTVLALAVAAAALYQAGPVRLGLSPTSLRDVLAAADAQALEPVLGVVVVLATAPAALLAFTAAREAVRPANRVRGALVAGLAAALAAAVLTPLGAVLLAAGLAVAEALAAAVATGRPTGRAVATGVLAVALLAGLVFAW
ncbi:hypothetical protein [Prauserella muralis]|uniref:Uncharacterized protein n=1 Tax=Prauserella muralis TaxID=588067 RepID=A0A2V4B1H9_9PSEU|nr:hypothetical protein [Prauserella muralis]PXY27238.1 hypothetical protein BAY60_12295 [Prauserella muralis]TWE23106.1 hypothetical protein FHX69_4365 [Prauserella muralis]